VPRGLCVLAGGEPPCATGRRLHRTSPPPPHPSPSSYRPPSYQATASARPRAYKTLPAPFPRAPLEFPRTRDSLALPALRRSPSRGGCATTALLPAIAGGHSDPTCATNRSQVSN
jgi:hypothetical protein